MSEQKPENIEHPNERTLSDIHRDIDALAGKQRANPFEVMDQLLSSDNKTDEQIIADLDKADKLNELIRELIDTLKKAQKYFSGGA